MDNSTRKYNKFQGGFAGSVYTCGVCGKRTRETGEGESAVDLCAYCYLEAGYENELSDGHITEAEFDAKIAALRLQYCRQ